MFVSRDHPDGTDFKAGQSLPVHDVRLTYGLLLVIQTDYCRSPEGALIHRVRIRADHYCMERL